LVRDAIRPARTPIVQVFMERFNDCCDVDHTCGRFRPNCSLPGLSLRRVQHLKFHFLFKIGTRSLSCCQDELSPRQHFHAAKRAPCRAQKTKLFRGCRPPGRSLQFHYIIRCTACNGDHGAAGYNQGSRGALPGCGQPRGGLKAHRCDSPPSATIKRSAGARRTFLGRDRLGWVWDAIRKGSLGLITGEVPESHNQYPPQCSRRQIYLTMYRL
jgi:hypothetical protein